jgi:SAM-dependent methyltransferase
MKGYTPAASFGEDVAESYRDVKRGDEQAAVAFLEALAAGGAVLELAIGAGRIALPLSSLGTRVDGIDISPAMLAQLRKKPGGKAISVTLGDFADVLVPGNYSLIYIVWNTLFNLLTQEDQIRCFENVARHLTEGGCFLVEAYVPAFLHHLADDQYVKAESISLAEVQLDALRHDAAGQMIEESHVRISEAGIRLNPVVQRYAWPSELDLMARIAGLRLRERWGSWDREPFDSTSSLHVSVYEKQLGRSNRSAGRDTASA